MALKTKRPRLIPPEQRKKSLKLATIAESENSRYVVCIVDSKITYVA